MKECMKEFSVEETERLVEILTTQAVADPDGTKVFFGTLVGKIKRKLPEDWYQFAGPWDTNPEHEANKLVDLAKSKGINPIEPKVSVLKILIRELLNDVGEPHKSWLESLITPRIQIHSQSASSSISPDRYSAVIADFAALIEISPQAIKIHYVSEDSNIFDLGVPSSGVQQLRSLLQSNDEQLRRLKVEKVILHEELDHSEEWVIREGKFELVTFPHLPVSSSVQSAPSNVHKGLNALISMMKVPEVRDKVVTFQADFQAANEQIDILTDCKRLHDLFQELEKLYDMVEFERRQLSADNSDTNWYRLKTYLGRPLQTTIDKLLKAANQPSFAIKKTWLIQKLEQSRINLQAAIERSVLEKLKISISLLRRVLMREPFRTNTQLVAAAEALRLETLANIMSSIHDTLAQGNFDLTAVHEIRDGAKAFVRLDDRLTTLIKNHNRLQDIADNLRLVENSLEGKIAELENIWPDIKSGTEALFGECQAEWTILKEMNDKLENARATAKPSKVEEAFLNYRSHAYNSFGQVDSDLLVLCQELQKIGDKLSLVLRVINE